MCPDISSGGASVMQAPLICVPWISKPCTACSRSRPSVLRATLVVVREVDVPGVQLDAAHAKLRPRQVA